MGLFDFLKRKSISETKAEAAARELLEQREIVANAAKKIETLEQVVIEHFNECDTDEPIIIGNAKVSPRKKVHFNFGDDEKADKNRKSFAKGLTVDFYHRVPHYNKIAEEVAKGEEAAPKIKKLMLRYNPLIEMSTSISITHVHPTVKNI